MTIPAPAPAPVPAAADDARPRSERWVFTLAAIGYLLAAVVLTALLWRDPASRVVAGNPYDADQFAWYFRYDATAVAHLRLPALITTGMNAPQGISVMWNTFMLLPGVLLAPVTLVAGPQVSLTVLMTAGFAGSGLAMFWVLRQWAPRAGGADAWGAALGGFVYAFSPALVQSSIGHYDLQFAVLPPLIVHIMLRLATGRSARSGRAGVLRDGVLLGLLASAQVLITEETLFDTGLAVVLLLAVLAVCRPGAVAGRVRDVAVGVAIGTGVMAAVDGYPLWVQFFGPIREHGSPFTPDYFKNDLAGLVQPSSYLLFHTADSAAFAANSRALQPEYLAYLGWPMLIALAVVAVLFWRVLAVRAATVVFVVLDVFSLGGTLMAGGHDHPAIKLPWYWLQTLPVSGAVIPDRFSIIADGAAAAMLAFCFDAARKRWGESLAGYGGGIVLGVALVAVLPLVPRPLPTVSTSAVPAGWSATFAELKLPAGASVLVVPLSTSPFTEPLRWQADTGVPASLYGGYFMGPTAGGQAATDGSGLPKAALYLNELWDLGAASDRSSRAGESPLGPATGLTAKFPTAGQAAAFPTVAQVRAQIIRWHPAAIVAVAPFRSVLGNYLTVLLGMPTVEVDGVLAWRLK